MSGLEPLMLIASAAGTAISAIGTIASGNAEAEYGMKQAAARQQSANFEAQQLDINAKDEFAAGQRDAQQLRRQKKLALSSLQAKAASSGFSATDPSNLAIAGEIEKYGSLQEATALYGGEVRARDSRLNAAAKRFSGAAEMDLASDYADSRRTAARYSAAGTILGGVSTMASRFGGTQKPKPTGLYGSGRSGGPMLGW